MLEIPVATIRNSLVVAGATTLFCVTLGSLCAYALARLTTPAALDGMAKAFDATYERAPVVQAHLVRTAATRFPKEARTKTLRYEDIPLGLICTAVDEYEVSRDEIVELASQVSDATGQQDQARDSAGSLSVYDLSTGMATNQLRPDAAGVWRVDRAAQVFLRTDGDIREVVRAELEVLGLDATRHIVSFYEPLLADLGVTHLYTSPLLEATPGSDFVALAEEGGRQVVVAFQGEVTVLPTGSDGDRFALVR